MRKVKKYFPLILVHKKEAHIIQYIVESSDDTLLVYFLIYLLVVRTSRSIVVKYTYIVVWPYTCTLQTRKLLNAYS